MKYTTVYKGFGEVMKTENGHEVVRVSDAVAILVYDLARRGIYLVRQRRTTLALIRGDEGYTLETAAGRFDNGLALRDLAVSEVREELGILLRPDQIKLIREEPLIQSSGYLMDRIYLCYAEAEAVQIGPGTHFGVPEENEYTERVFIAECDLSTLQVNDVITFALIQWFLRGRFGGRPQ